MLPNLQRYYAANDYPYDAHGFFQWRVATRRRAQHMTFRECFLGELALAQIPHCDMDNAEGLPQVRIDTECGWDVLLTFDRDGGLLTVDVEPTDPAEAPAPC